jgi:hypothetical protein
LADMFAKWPIVAERASPGTMSTAGLTRPIAARLRQFGLRPPTFSGDAFPGCFWLTDGGSPSRCRAYFVDAFLTTAFFATTERTFAASALKTAANLDHPTIVELYRSIVKMTVKSYLQLDIDVFQAFGQVAEALASLCLLGVVVVASDQLDMPDRSLMRN